MLEVATQKQAVVRKRKAHRKSRLGCGNCKIRSVKCDEAKPTCRRCEVSGFTCNYSHSAPTLQLAQSSVFKLNISPSRNDTNIISTGAILRETSLQPAFRIPTVSPMDGRLSEYALRPDDLATLDRFQKRTVWTFGNAPARSRYIKILSGLAIDNPYLFHIFLAVSLLHDIHLSSTQSSQLATPASHRSALAFHWYHGTAIFKKLLASPSPATTLTSSQRDALWVASSMLGAASTAHVDLPDPSTAWPLKKPESGIDLEWLKMGHGKHVVWTIMDPTRTESVWYDIFKDVGNILHTSIDGRAPIDAGVLPPLFDTIFELSAPGSSPKTNPYHIPACVLSRLWGRKIDENNFLTFLAFLSQIDVRYRTLVEKKDPRAMLLLLYWHSMIAPFDTWWLRRRSVVEGIAMCAYLEEHYADDHNLMELLQHPKGKLVVEFARGFLTT